MARVIYALVATFCKGGYFYHFDSMAHTEIARRHDCVFLRHANSGVSQFVGGMETHEHTLYMLCLMLLSMDLVNNSVYDIVKIYHVVLIIFCSLLQPGVCHYTRANHPAPRL